MTAKVTQPSFTLPILDAPRPFNVLSTNLKALGSLTVADFLNGPRSVDDYWAQTRASGIFTSSSGPDGLDDNSGEDGPVPRLYAASQRVFGSSDHLSFEFIEIEPTAKQCILTITRTDGLSRTYRTDPIYSSKNDAKKAVAEIAETKGALEFIKHGDSDAVKARKNKLAPLDHANKISKDDVIHVPDEDDEAAQAIEDCCIEWRAGQVKPHWITFHDFRDTTKFGTALRVNLTSNISRTFSVEPSFDSPVASKNACARIAIQDDVLDFIRHGNGQTEPLELIEPNKPENALPRRTKLSLQAFYESLPRPFPENFGDKPAIAINAQGWLNKELQNAIGGGVRTFFYTLTEPGQNVHGCVLRVESFGDCKTFLLDPCIAKRGDVRAAVCLLAASQRLGEHIRSISRSVDSRMTPDIRRTALRVQHIVTAELAQRHSNAKLRVYFDFTREREAFGCNMRIELSSMDAGTNDVLHVFRAPPRYRNKPDAKLGACYIGAEEGAVELMRYRGREPPPAYIPFIPNSTAYVTLISKRQFEEERKRKVHEERDRDSDSDKYKKRKMDGSEAGESESLEKLRSQALHSLRRPLARDSSIEFRSSESIARPPREPVRRTAPGPTITRFPPPSAPVAASHAQYIHPTPPVHAPQYMPAPHTRSGYSHAHVVQPVWSPMPPPPQHPYYSAHTPYASAPYGYPPPPMHSGYANPYAPPPPYPHSPPHHMTPMYGSPSPMQFSPPGLALPHTLSPPRPTPPQMTSALPVSPRYAKSPPQNLPRSPPGFRSPPRSEYNGRSGSKGTKKEKWDHGGYQEQEKQDSDSKGDDDVDALIKKATKYNDKQALIDYCQQLVGVADPLFFNQRGNVGVFVNDEKHELPEEGSEDLSITEKEQRLAKIVLGQMKRQRS